MITFMQAIRPTTVARLNENAPQALKDALNNKEASAKPHPPPARSKPAEDSAGMKAEIRMAKERLKSEPKAGR